MDGAEGKNGRWCLFWFWLFEITEREEWRRTSMGAPRAGLLLSAMPPTPPNGFTRALHQATPATFRHGPPRSQEDPHRCPSFAA